MVDRQNEIVGPAFFPGGSGMLKDTGMISDKPIMILGHDQDNEKGFNRTIRGDKKLTPPRGETYSFTWRQLQKSLAESGIEETDCFFTNFIMGIRKNAPSNTGTSPALKEARFVEKCAALLIRQIDLQKPEAILCLGIVPLRLLSLISHNVHYRYVAVDSFNEIHERGAEMVIDDITELPGFKTKLIVVAHPSSKRRKESTKSKGQKERDSTEIDMLRCLVSDLRAKRSVVA